MRLLRHPVASFVVFTILVSLVITFYEGLQSEYGFTPGDYKTVTTNGVTTTGNILDQFKSMNLISGLNLIMEGIIKLNPPTGSSDILGGLASAGIGTLKSVVGLATFPFEVIGIILAYYTGIPAIIYQLGFLVVVYVGFILLSAYLRSEV